MHHWFAKLEPFSVALKRGIKKDFWWWPAADFAFKYMLILTVVYVVGQKVITWHCMHALGCYYQNSSSNCSDFQVLALMNMLVLLLLQFFVHPYKNKTANYLESFALLVLIVLLGFGNTPAFVESVDVVLWPLFYLPVFVEVVIIAAYVGFTLW